MVGDMETRVPRSKRWKRLGAAAAGVAATASGLIAFAPPAAAHYAPIWHGNDLGQVTSTHTTVSIYDGECDGNTVFIQYQATGESFVRQTMDLNGCNTGGNSFTVPSGRRVYRARVCETNVGCTGWSRH
jgi:hypothetical protein